jgi:hypothetical protein
MVFGTLAGSFLGTIANSRSNQFNIFNPDWAGFLLVNLILAFIAGVILTRRKDVQSFITIEDFWGHTCRLYCWLHWF